jgi:hypothetical protein
MSDQLDFFAHARDTDPDTSHKGAEDVRPRLGKQCARWLSVLRDYEDKRGEGATAWDLIRWQWNGVDLMPQQNVVARRLTDLRDLGLIYDTGGRRKGGHGSQLIVWTRTYAGRNA